jgi:DNA-directed RNA polymerase specialized sigma24 family protein
MTQRKAVDLIRKDRRRKEVGESHLASPAGGANPRAIHAVAGRDAPPDLIAQSLEEVGRLLALLNDKERRAVELRMAGYTIAEIAHACGRADATIERYLKAARDKWAAELGRSDSADREK